jgi:hypothetical protein
MSGKTDLLYKDGPDTVTHELVHTRFLELLQRDQDTGLSIPWKKALLEPPNPLEPKKRPGLKLPVLLGLWIVGIGVTVFVWFSFLH